MVRIHAGQQKESDNIGCGIFTDTCRILRCSETKRRVPYGVTKIYDKIGRMNKEQHFCDESDVFPVDKFLQLGQRKGKNLLVVGESPAMNGWVKSGKAFYTVEGRLLPSGRNLNKLFEPFDLTVEQCNFTELVKCSVGDNRKLLVKCAPKWKNIFENQVALCNPRLILILGVETLRIFNLVFNSSLVMGEFGELNFKDSLVNVLPIYHPSPIAPRNQSKNLEIIEIQKGFIKELIEQS